jgi:protein CrcB
VEDIGLADPQGLPFALAAWEAYERLGSPEGELALAQLVIHLATAPKSNAAYVAWKEAQAAARETGSLMPPAHILNAPTGLMRGPRLRAAATPTTTTRPDAFSGQNYFPDGMERRQFYRPTDRGAEAELAERLDRWAALRAERRAGADERRVSGGPGRRGGFRPALLGVRGRLGRARQRLPWGTLAVNAAGSTAIGALASLGLQDNTRLLLVTGLLGGFTTFSAFSLETAQLWQRAPWLAALYVAASLGGGFAGFAAGQGFARGG